MIEFTTATNPTELLQILELQQQNLPEKLSEIDKKEQGFVTVRHDFELLKKMNDVHPHIIAKNNSTVVGYALSMSKIFRNDIPILIPMFDEIDTTSKGAKPYILMGQICIDKHYRGKGVFRGLYTKMKEEFSGIYDSIITEFDEKNTRSVNAHKAIGFKTLKTYTSHNQDWEIVYLAI
ncbi:GNAT family N-acetyltransferase [Tenacibaculum caenipelagi]|uniref:Ribosomal protein S18 acetylase RimI-like enzyme n=1 Tax=Tenacibaculum caenipelagi TaxID=1325435 RepID=A0A4R6TFQ3_9FLAO|nr:GNAT family N-acetyltransferase [Tenacibaculum caenipelagi]TDQ28828.1 ribosomal protein S18 acetylase RimI-like enzyme [Tenacibaculum caenipelagi]